MNEAFSENIFNENINFARRKNDSARIILNTTYLDAAAMFREQNTMPADCDDVVRLFYEINGNNMEASTTFEFAFFCRAFASEIPIKFFESEEDDEYVPKIAYLQNTFSDKAYSRFSQNFSFIAAIYFTEFREVCEEVYYGRCSHALLPIYNSRDGMLMSFYRLILKYDLKIISVCNIKMTDESVMRYALLSKNLPRKLTSKYIDISVVLTDSNSCGRLVSSLEILGAEVVMLNSYPLEYSDDGNGLILQLDISSSKINAVVLYLEGSKFRYNILGNYDIIK